MMSWLKEQNRLTREFIRGDLRDQLWMSGVAFAALMVLGFVLGIFLKDFAANFVGFFSQQMEGSDIMNSDGTVNLLPLLGNNIRASISTILYGCIPFIYFPALSLGINSMLLGFFAAFYLNNGMSMLFYFAALIPHGIFELPALVFSIALGLYLCRMVTNYVRNNPKGVMVPAMQNILRVFLLRALPLFVIASIVESYVTPWIISYI